MIALHRTYTPYADKAFGTIVCLKFVSAYMVVNYVFPKSELEWCTKKQDWTDSVILCRLYQLSKYVVQYCWMAMKHAVFSAEGGRN